MSEGLKISQKRKEKLFAKKIKRPSNTNIENFKLYNKTYNKVRRAAKKLYYKNQFDRFTRNIKQTWSVIREVTGIKKQKDQIPDFFKSNGQIITDYLEIANGFNSFFSQIGPNLAADRPPEVDLVPAIPIAPQNVPANQRKNLDLKKIIVCPVRLY
jgi:hypothetical protein